MIESYSTDEVSHLTGLSFGQLDYWCRTGLVRPSVNEGRGSGEPGRRWSADDVDRLALIARLLAAGVSLQRIRRDRDPRKTATAVAAAMGAVLEGAA